MLCRVSCQSSLSIALHIDDTDSTGLRHCSTLVVIITINCNSSPFIVVLEGFLAFTPYFQLGTISILYFNQHIDYNDSRLILQIEFQSDDV